MEAPNHYELLCVAPEATAEQIRIAYRRLIRVYHPDVASEAGEAMTLRLNDAQRVLLDDTLRAQYDRTIRAPGAAQHRTGRMPDSQPRAPRPNTEWRPTPSPTESPRRQASVAWSPAGYAVWMSVMVLSVTTILIATGVVFALCYTGPFTLFSPRIVPPIVVGIAWLVAGITRPSKLLIALMVIGAGLWPLAAAGVEPFTMLLELSSPVLPGLTIIAIAVVVFRTAAPRASLLSRARPTRAHSAAFGR